MFKRWALLVGSQQHSDHHKFKKLWRNRVGRENQIILFQINRKWWVNCSSFLIFIGLKQL